MNKKILLLVAAFAVLIIGAVVLITVTSPTPTDAVISEPAADVSAGTADASVAPAQSGEPASPEDRIAKAEALIGESYSREEIEEILGECDKFDMNSNGCERGVYAGEFYYEDFTLFSRTYDKGGTYRVVSVNK